MLTINERCWVVVACAALGFCGCSKTDATTRYDISGTVTFVGKPIPAGTILFLPDGSKHNFGPPGFAKIKAGKYDTALDGEGTIGGPHTVRISGFDGRGTTEELPDGLRLFPDYTTVIDLPKEKATRDFQVQAK